MERVIKLEIPHDIMEKLELIAKRNNRTVEEEIKYAIREDYKKKTSQTRC